MQKDDSKAILVGGKENCQNFGGKKTRRRWDKRHDRNIRLLLQIESEQHA